ncbi:3,5-dihydroxyphenylacetyl-CoA synthase DpgA [Saccharothrix variisporea]|uniref:(3,5-dihydroxycyclohex-3-enyl)acetyl-CoA synthase n=1 Tax=Saccharothrix variisporea TaxID=543527 RepID=A0A495XIW2_9PSEU|nr:3,5-dihydroxyphenylacetyl-CoA synthase DpgA [Saccharothrix variisporea]RKT74431.1 (3,5-dihydroxycyclohex-3-enyl)acetyl-CoA synthase [Saccharothrix variisporea]
MTIVDGGARLLAVGTATPPESFSQQELLDRFAITDRATVSVFRNSHIERRNLYLAADRPAALGAETQGELLDKHLAGALEMGEEAIRKCLAEAGCPPGAIDYLCCVTSTGFLCPGLSARLVERLGMRADVSRMDIVGMGCNAGLNGLNPVTTWATANPGRLAVMLCVEVCSAAYAHDGTMRTAVVNALFGDGAAAVLVGSSVPAAPGLSPQLVSFRSHVLTDALPAMRFDWDPDRLKYSFYLDRKIPYVIGAHAAEPVTDLLARQGLTVGDVDHWVVHSGGKKVIDGIKYNLDLTDHDLRHTTSVLRDHGNLSSGSFLFSYERLLRENVVREGDHGVMMTMGPGTTIETALLRW